MHSLWYLVADTMKNKQKNDKTSKKEKEHTLQIKPPSKKTNKHASLKIFAHSSIECKNMQ